MQGAGKALCLSECRAFFAADPRDQPLRLDVYLFGNDVERDLGAVIRSSQNLLANRCVSHAVRAYGRVSIGT